MPRHLLICTQLSYCQTQGKVLGLPFSKKVSTSPYCFKFYLGQNSYGVLPLHAYTLIFCITKNMPFPFTLFPGRAFSVIMATPLRNIQLSICFGAARASLDSPFWSENLITQ